MSIRDRLQPASFRGAVFGVMDVEVVFGRRNQLHEYPLRDDPYAEDLGRKAREFTFNAFIMVKDDYAARDALISAIEDDETPGTLVHPTLGVKTVIPKECRITYRNVEGGLEYFTLSFIEAGINKFPSSLSDTSFFSDAFASSAITNFISEFSSYFNVVNLPDFLHDNALQSLIGGGNKNGFDFSSVINKVLGQGNTDSEDYSEFVRNFTNFQDSASTDLSDPSTLGAKVTGIISDVSSLYPDNPAKVIQAQKQIYAFGDTFQSIPLTTPSRIQQSVNESQLVGLVKNTSLAEMIRATSVMDFASRQDAISVRDDVDSYISPRLITLADAGHDTPYLALNKARAAMVKDINIRAANLKNIKYVRTADSVPALVFAYKQYEDASRDAEIVERNHIRNPMFLPPQSNIEILV